MAHLPMDPQMTNIRCWEEETMVLETAASYQGYWIPQSNMQNTHGLSQILRLGEVCSSAALLTS